MDVLYSLQRQTNVLNLSIGELTKDIEYRVQSMNNVETKFGTAVSCVLQDPASGGIINVFLPKSVQLPSEELQRYNQHEADPVNLIFRGTRNRSFIIKFVPAQPRFSGDV
ncbi:unnamed protein product [Macrosiphum euphorbiae]|uniref:Uncharacterized protein n=1 Tax=Macrosiphum euphorbiae TaxID=13131 RepID=A0AAV0XNX5_9HEMI|nr:unnamed protein product [Macrosiphum euphorbiae]